MFMWLTLCIIVCIHYAHGDAATNTVKTNLRKAYLVANQSSSSLVTPDYEDALEQVDQLSLITRYTGVGYNIIRGNPEGDFDRGGVDPGIKTTHEIFDLTYKRGKQAFYKGKAMDVPDQVSFHVSQSCAASHSVKAFSGRKSYMKQLDRSVSVSGGYSGLFVSVSFSLSHGMSKVESKTEKKKSVIIQKTKICNYGTARYLYANALARQPEYTLSRSFINSVKYELPSRYYQRAYMKFIDKWGTHIILTVDVGTRRIFRSSATYKEVYKYLKKKRQLSTSVRGRYGLFHASSSFDMRKLNENIDENTKLGKKMTEFTIGSKAVPLPIHIELELLTKALDRNWWEEGSWRNDKIGKKQQNLMRALKEYPGYVHAKKNTDPLIKLALQEEWPDGTYALPQATWGCPDGWSSGWRFQDTENNNRKSPGIESKMKVEVGKDIKFYYCVKTSRKDDDVPWPKGRYCIAKKDDCPTGFREGSIYWDDQNHRNKNNQWGTLPDGRYDKNTLVEYCCRSDSNPQTPMALPTSKPFILYRYGGRCQKVEGMYCSDVNIFWDDENRKSRSKCRGNHPDTTCRDNQNLNFCIYHKINKGRQVNKHLHQRNEGRQVHKHRRQRNNGRRGHNHHKGRRGHKHRHQRNKGRRVYGYRRRMY